ncbi:hypothetical protein SAMN05216377_11223 [Pseudonocardia oroxyli]|uniref:Uncharacterized protein n=1 Tax=Pseudonocardia oroxyli TaxID=366584 RepID=A0A1G7UE76_PSEOR|nr:hypothetical protein SAMN05216377_11223 [Pseudonocardia oroxyli]
MSTTTVCPDCTGSGSCDTCDGYGTAPGTHPVAGDSQDCPACLGDGVCPGCHGTGIPCTATTPMETSCH